MFTGTQRPEILYKYLDEEGGIGLLTYRQHWLRCPLQFDDQQDCQADRMVGFDLDEIRCVEREELVSFLTGPPTPLDRDSEMAQVMQQLRDRPGGWTREQAYEAADECSELNKQQIMAMLDQIPGQLRDFLRSVRVLSLTDLPNNARMWRDYAADGSGICIGFRYVPDIDNIIRCAKPVDYFDAPPPIATPREWARHNLGLETIPLDNRAGQTLYLKNRERYEYEQEWRIVTKSILLPDADHEGLLRVPAEDREFAEIILGPNIAYEDAIKAGQSAARLRECATVRTATWQADGTVLISK